MSSEAEIIDWEQFISITDNGAPEFMDIFQDFLEATPVLFESLRTAIGNQDAKSTASFAHQLKGSAANFGFIGVCEPIAQIESTTRSGSFEKVSDQLEQAWSAFQVGGAAVAAKYPG